MIFEKIIDGITPVCDDCSDAMPLRVLRSAAGYYLGRGCSCGPYCRESGYFASRDCVEEFFYSVLA